MLKVCKKCNEELPVERFSRVGGGTERRRGSCKSCQAEYLKKHRRENPDYDWRSTKSPQARKRKADYAKRVRNLPDVRARKQANDRKQAAKALARKRSTGLVRCRSCKEDTPFPAVVGWTCLECRALNRRSASRVKSFYSRRKKSGASGVAERFTDRDVADRWGSVCYYCAGPWEELDHFVPVAEGGDHTVENCRPACAACNNAKRASMPTEWAASVVMIELKRRGIDLPPGVLESLRSLAA